MQSIQPNHQFRGLISKIQRLNLVKLNYYLPISNHKLIFFCVFYLLIAIYYLLPHIATAIAFPMWEKISGNINGFPTNLIAKGDYIYTVGLETIDSNPEWRIEKRKINDGDLDYNFGHDGVINEFSWSTNDIATAIVDSNDGFYVSGNMGNGNYDTVYTIKYDYAGNMQWADCECDGVVDGEDSHAKLTILTSNSNVYRVSYDSWYGRWYYENLTNDGGGTESYISVDDPPRAIANDETYIYSVGSQNNSTKWRIEKRRVSDFALCTSANCGTAFDTDGIIELNPSGQIYGIAQSVVVFGDYIYVGGWYSFNDGAYKTRGKIEKINKNTGVRETAGKWPLIFDDSDAGHAVKTLVVEPHESSFYVGRRWNNPSQNSVVEKYDLSSAQLIWRHVISDSEYNSPNTITLIGPESGRTFKSILISLNWKNDTRWRVDKISQNLKAGDPIRAAHFNALANTLNYWIDTINLPFSKINTFVQQGEKISQSYINGIINTYNKNLPCTGVWLPSGGPDAGDPISAWTVSQFSDALDYGCYLVNGVHSQQDCGLAPGQGTIVSDSNGRPFCFFSPLNNYSSCSQITSGNGGWQQYNSWTQTEAITHSDNNLEGCTAEVDKPSSCTTGSHLFSNWTSAIESCKYYDYSVFRGDFGDHCGSTERTGYAKIIKVGCY